MTTKLFVNSVVGRGRSIKKNVTEPTCFAHLAAPNQQMSFSMVNYVVFLGMVLLTVTPQSWMANRSCQATEFVII